MKVFAAAAAALFLTAQTPILAATGAAFDPERVARVASDAALAGTVLVARGDKVIFDRAFGSVEPGKPQKHRVGQVWRWASVTKQITATIAMQEVAAGRLDLDKPLNAYLPESKAPYAATITPRMLMQHISGLPRTEDSPISDKDGWSQFYVVPLDSPETGVRWCEGPTPRKPPAEFRYGDCDFIMMGAILERISGKPYATLIRERIAHPLGLKSLGMFPRNRPTVAGYEGGKREPSRFRLENFGPAGALYGTMRDLFSFDRALMTGKLIPDAQRDVMWTGNPAYGYAALGQWAFSAPVKGCGPDPIRFIDRRGFIGGVVLRNLILPDLDMVLIATSNRAESDTLFGEIWQGKGLTHDLLAAAICPK